MVVRFNTYDVLISKLENEKLYTVKDAVYSFPFIEFPNHHKGVNEKTFRMSAISTLSSLRSRHFDGPDGRANGKYPSDLYFGWRLKRALGEAKKEIGKRIRDL